MVGIQLVAAVFAVAMGYQTFVNFKQDDLGMSEVILWELVWGALLLVTLLPGPFQRLIGVVHVARLLDLVVIGGMLVLGLITYQLYVATRRLKRAIDELVRQQALDQLAANDVEG